MKKQPSGFVSSVMVLCLAPLAWGQAGVPVPQDSPIYKSFELVKSQPAYRMTINMHSSDPRMAQAAATGFGFSAPERIQQGGTSQVITHMKIPAMDMRGAVDDWEIRAVARNGHAARMFSSPAIARLNARNEQLMAMQLAMMDRAASVAVAQALAQGPADMITAGLVTGETAFVNVEAPRKLHEAEHFWDWKCVDQPGASATDSQSKAQLTDAKLIGDDTVNGAHVTAYDFYTNDSKGSHGPVRLYVAKDTGLPLRIHMDDPQGRGSVDMDYSYGQTANIEVPDCLAK